MSAGAGAFAVRRVILNVNTITVAGVAPPSVTVSDSGGLTTTVALTGTAAQSFNLFQLAAGGAIMATKIKTDTAFSGGGVATLTAEAGVVGDTARYIPQYNCFLAPSATGVGHTVTSQAIVRAIAVAGRATPGSLATLTNAQVGDRVIGVYPVTVPATTPPVVIGVDVEAVISVAGAIQTLSSVMTTGVYIFVLQAGGGMETDGVPSVPTPGVPATNPAAGTQITGTLRATGGTGFVNQLVAGQVEFFFLCFDWPQVTLLAG